MPVFDRLFLAGEWTSPSGTDTIDVFSARDGTVMGTVPAGTAQDVDSAVRAAAGALPEWSATDPAERARFLQAISDGLKANADRLAKIIAQEVGMPIKLAERIQVALPIATFANYARIARDHPWEETVGNSLVIREPVGVVAAITPWNYPLHQIALKVAAALAAGCTVVLKPSEVAPFNAFVLAEVMADAKLPEGVFNLVSGDGATAGEVLVGHERVDMISFTGSTRAGKRIAEVAAKHVKRIALELGGKSASIILDDADLANAVRSTVGNCFLNSGQTCTAWTRMLVPQVQYDEAARLAVEAARKFVPGDPLLDGTRLGPLTSAAQLDRVRGYIRKGIDEGARLLVGGTDTPQGAIPGGYYVEPTVFGEVKPESTIAREEIFGPVLSIITYRDDDEAIRIANDTNYGLAGAVWSGDDARARRVARRVRAGQIDINGGRFNPNAPFGGFRESGIGREGGVYGLDEFLEYKSLQLQSS